MKRALSTKLHYYATISLSIILLVIMSSTSYAIVHAQSHTNESNSDLLQSDRDYYGFIESRPDGTAGTWVVSGRNFTATDNTRLVTDDGELTIGRCVSVDYEGDLAREIESEPDSDCANAPNPPTPPDPGTPDYYGFIESRPDGTAGTWVVSGRSFTATDNTRLVTDDGELTIGRCVSVDFEGDMARKIESEPDSDCANAPNPPTPPDPGTPDYYGFIESRPDGTAGTWVISGRSFTATDNTRLVTDDGELTIGRCVSVDFEGDIAREIESEPDSDCANAPNPPGQGSVNIYLPLVIR